ncbi:PfkB family carbohydrate kinase [Pedobacter sp.]|uniref:PfkB family carbohydrate kinase n=1 Tax=Pedobacter sp. TaxID=1411316 RepID=UPI003D7FB782
MGKILSFGELLLRICPDAEGNWIRENNLPFYIGGAELNVATALSLWGMPSAYMTALPKNAMTEQLVAYIGDLGIDHSAVQFQGERVGLYYLHKGKDLKNSSVIYDRKYSSFSTLKTGDVKWEDVFKDVSWFHFSAICPAVSEAAAAVCEEALKEAVARNITVSVDLNYRALLWKYGKEPVEVLPALAKYCTVIMGNIWAAEKMLGIPVPADLSGKENYLEQAEKTSRIIQERFPNCETVANTFRFDEEGGVKYYTTLFTEGKFQVSKQYFAAEIVDKVGSGDCYMAGLIYGLYQGKSIAETLDFATAAAFSKLFVASDATNLKPAEIMEKVKNYEN